MFESNKPRPLHRFHTTSAGDRSVSLGLLLSLLLVEKQLKATLASVPQASMPAHWLCQRVWYNGARSPIKDHLICLVVKASASRAEDPGFESRLLREFFGVESYQWLKIGTPVATLPGAWRYRVSAWTGWPGVSILWLGEMESLICNFCLSVAARKIVWADPSLRYARMLLGR